MSRCDFGRFAREAGPFERVRAGSGFLSMRLPDWRSFIDLRRLDVRSATLDILGQIAGKRKRGVCGVAEALKAAHAGSYLPELALVSSDQAMAFGFLALDEADALEAAQLQLHWVGFVMGISSERHG